MLTITKIPDTQLLTLLEHVSRVSKDHNIEFFVIGALARDAIFEWAHNIAAPRRTRDVDLGLRVKSWDQYRLIKQILIDTGEFQQGRDEQRLLFNNQIPLDIVPFGEIADENQIRWPPDFAIEMDIAGFEDAHNAAVEVRFSETPELNVRIASPAGLAAMKIISWTNRDPVLRTKDAEDLAFIMKYYLDTQGVDRISTEFPDWLDEHFDYDIASSRLLAVDIRILSSDKIVERLRLIIGKELHQGVGSQLVAQLANEDSSDSSIELSINKLEVFLLELKH